MDEIIAVLMGVLLGLLIVTVIIVIFLLCEPRKKAVKFVRTKFIPLQKSKPIPLIEHDEEPDELLAFRQLFSENKTDGGKAQ
ncbi:hypothetical protein HZA96_02560 [Candidatus Woesearchaeota archaeon]|nr:hypothetical protein [Candidatus Woesearchaeota archaeon]